MNPHLLRGVATLIVLWLLAFSLIPLRADERKSAQWRATGVSFRTDAKGRVTEMDFSNCSVLETLSALAARCKFDLFLTDEVRQVISKLPMQQGGVKSPVPGDWKELFSIYLDYLDQGLLEGRFWILPIVRRKDGQKPSEPGGLVILVLKAKK